MRARNAIIRAVGVIAAVSISSLTGCGGGGGGQGGGGEPASPSGPGCATPTSPGCPTTLFVSRSVTPDRFQFGIAELEASASLEAARVDFVIDGTVVASSTSGGKEPGLDAAVHWVTWDTSSVSDGAHSFLVRAFDAQGQSVESTPAAILVANTLTIPLQLSTQDILPPPAPTAATGEGQLTVNLATGAISGHFVLSGITTVDGAHVHRGYAGSTGASVLALSRNDLDPNRWDVPAGSLLSMEDARLLATGGLYVDAHSSSLAFPQGALRAQMLPQDLSVVFASMTGGQMVPPVTTNLQGVAAVTVAGSELIINLNAFEAGSLVPGTGAHAHVGASGTVGPDVLEGFTRSDATWTSGPTLLVEPYLTSVPAGEIYVVLDTEAHPAGAIRGQLTVPLGPTMSELQSAVFTPKCSGCHDGSGASLPQSMDLREGQAHASLVDVSSTQQSAIKRVEPFVPAASYLVHKLEGVHTITGERMPQSGPYLTRGEIDAIRSWIRYGASD